MNEQWKDVAGYEGRYQVSDQGRVKALSFRQRYTHWRTGQELFRKTKERIVACQPNNAGYLLVHLHLDNKRVAHLVHRLVAAAFLPARPAELVNHKNGRKQDNSAANLEWATDAENKLHAVAHGLNVQAVAVIDPTTGLRFGSISQAAKACRKSHRVVRATFTKEARRV